ncbi:unnamed protein product [Clavelina lepadiformis]|uniref:Ubiquitin-related modifier 1 homolog n=1 Tax=Clavelina lepadiformis TaxID=159417 RepID=A0ABP0GCM7_CLALP
MALTVILEFLGGAEFLFGHVKHHTVSIEKGENKLNISQLLMWIKENLLQERLELFMQGCTVRPGILVLVNDVDWSLLGELTYEIEENDRITFISTLHGG